MSGKRYVGDFMPAIKTLGIPVVVKLSASGVAATANSLDIFQVPISWQPNPKGIVAVLCDVQFIMQSLGTSGASGTFGWRLKVARTGLVYGATSFAYNATVLTAMSDLRDNNQSGVPLIAGDTVALDCTAVPGSISVGGTVGVRMTVLCFGAKG